jgi:3-isopropylmalate/(R)-2-methylmalate dehydratase small subunit
MSMPQFASLTSRIVPLPVNDIDTDQIIPARFLKAVDKNGLGESLFADWRYRSNGYPDPGFVLNKPQFRGAQILLTGENFGCGSSREHAPWALTAFGFRAIISTSFADIFRTNALKNGLLPVVVDESVHRDLFDMVAQHPELQVHIDLSRQSLDIPGREQVEFPIDGFSRTCLLEGIDELGYILTFADAIAAYESAHAPTSTGE